MSTEVIGTRKVFQNGKTVIPSEIRRSLGVGDGDRVVWMKDSAGRYYMEKAERRGVRYP